jgi:HEAT repeat protein
VRKEAIKAVGTMGNVAYLANLLQLLKDPDTGIVTAAIVAIGRLKDPRAEKPLLILLTHPAPEIRSAAAAALADLE